jgi:peptide/nickel transport system substrate-binding protein
MFLAWLVIVMIGFYGIVATMQRYDDYYLADAAASGGSYSEGMTGESAVLNPVYALSTPEQDLTTLIFSGLSRQNPNGQIEPDLAKSWEISADRKSYTFTLRDGLKWHDGQPLTTDDVAFTIGVIQDPNAKSPLASDWKGVRYEVIDGRTIKFLLPNTFSNFLANTRIGIIPKHLLDSVKRSNLRLHAFNQSPVGSGPYRFDDISSDGKVVRLRAFDNYHFGKPYIESFKYHTYANSNEVMDGYARTEIQGMGKVEPQYLDKIRSIGGLKINQLTQPAYVAVFFNMSRSPFNNPELRRLLAASTNRSQIIGETLQGTASEQLTPLSNRFAVQPDTNGLKFDQNAARAALAKLGLLNHKFVLATVRGGSYEQVAKALQRQWQAVGLTIDLDLHDPDTFVQDVLRARNYDMVLYGQNVGSDGDVYSYWHSSQSLDPGLNLSEYKNNDVDRNLESARLGQEPDYKRQKYSAFVAQWVKDVPAVVLYSPLYYYAQSNVVHGFRLQQVTEPSDRFYDVQKWFIFATKQLRARIEQ